MSRISGTSPYTMSDAPEQRESRNPLRRLDHYIDSYESSFERLVRVKQEIQNKPAKASRADHVLSCPEQFRSKSLRALIKASRYLEELGEGITDVSSLIERLARNVISGGNKADIAQVIGAGVGRALAGTLSIPGVAVHKAAGLSLYALSALTGGLALAGVKLFGAKLRSPSQIETIRKQARQDKSLYQHVATPMSQAKHKVLEGAFKALEKLGVAKNHTLQKWCRHLSAHHHVHELHNSRARRANCNYMWNNLHQYGPVTKALMNAAYGVFQGFNKIVCSFDKYAGVEIGRRLLYGKLGKLLGVKIGLCITVGAMTAISVPTAPLAVGLSWAGACACAFALLALIAAKANVRFRNDWKGDIDKPIRLRPVPG